MACSILATLTAIVYLIVCEGTIKYENGFDGEIQYDYSSSRECRTISDGYQTTEYCTYKTSKELPPNYRNKV